MNTLSFQPLGAERGARLLVLAMRALGGQGSGNFGHEGRKGEVGGSSPASPGEYLKGKTIQGAEHFNAKQTAWEKKANGPAGELIRRWKNGYGTNAENENLSAADRLDEQHVADRVSALIKSAPQYQGIVYRGTSFEEFGKAKNGQVVTLDRPVSTTRDPKVAERFMSGGKYGGGNGTILEIHTKSGAAIENLGLKDKRGNIRYQKEREVVLAGKTRFKVEHVSDVRTVLKTEYGKFPQRFRLVRLRQV